MIPEAYVAKLASLTELSPDDHAQLANLNVRTFRMPRHGIVLERDAKPDYVYMLLSGWAARYEVRKTGARRITGFLLPGDFCGIHAICNAAMDHSIVALTDCVIGRVDRETMSGLARSSQAIFNAIWRAKLQEEAILRKWLVYASDAQTAVSHLLCELYSRAERVGLATNGHLWLPLIQPEIGDALGLMAVHVNRVLHGLRARGLFELTKHQLVIKDGKALARAAEYEGSYIASWERHD